MLESIIVGKKKVSKAALTELKGVDTTVNPASSKTSDQHLRPSLTPATAGYRPWGPQKLGPQMQWTILHLALLS